MGSKACGDWMDGLLRGVEHVRGQEAKIEKVASRIFDALRAGGVLHVFGSGHSNIVAEELFHRAGGLIPVNPLFEPMLMPFAGPRRTGPLERTEGVGKIVFNANDLRTGEVLLLASHSGINPAAVELAQLAREKGLFTCAVTSLAHSRSVPARAGGKKLFEVVDESIDTGAPIGDACVTLDRSDVKAGPLSSALSIVACELLAVRVAEKFSEAGEAPPVYQSANLPGGEARNQALEAPYRARLRWL